MTITTKKSVGFNYRLTDKNGQLIDASGPGEPFYYLHGYQNIVPGLEKELDGLKAGDKKQVVVSAADGYGELNENLVFEVPRANFPADMNIEAGMEFQTKDDNGQPMFVVVTDVTNDFVKVDGNHPLAGIELHFDVEITDVRDATLQELAHGHAHAGGHDH